MLLQRPSVRYTDYQPIILDLDRNTKLSPIGVGIKITLIPLLRRFKFILVKLPFVKSTFLPSLQVGGLGKGRFLLSRYSDSRNSVTNES